MAWHRRFGKRPWTSEEVQTLVDLYPDYSAARRVPQGHSSNAIKRRAPARGIQCHRHIWTGIEVVRLRRLARSGASLAEMAKALALQESQIKGALQRHRISRRREVGLTGHPLLDEVRRHCFELGISMRRLDRMARTKRYFQAGGWA